MTATLTAIRAATPDRPPSRLLYAGLLAGPLFVGTFLLEGAFRDGYDPMRHPVSSLALGPGGWVQVVNFVVAGLLTVLFAAGRRSVQRVLIAVWGIGLIGAGAFLTDPVSGYPAGVPETVTWHGTVHDLVFSLPAFLAIAVAMFADVRRSRWSALFGVAFLALFALASAGFAQTAPFVDVAGLLQRLAIGVGWLWIAVLAVRQRRGRP
ncbi:DUF998 domain-containing protein [Dactylosporangium sp. AC04546]|uniref:DUF998 domain-containing protein n=1 Tax=Dactylosporangium sp. AC04546 TaxID=2862460 RepID=UPI001EE02157|nr:DUF998 domain-containing protein [Dactylosporangium sp. AC04546]WVK87999.1 DUF998 domain-containing protein [Dactylosporangium sp. AC04546]